MFYPSEDHIGEGVDLLDGITKVEKMEFHEGKGISRFILYIFIY
jgi:hypothetical protein